MLTSVRRDILDHSISGNKIFGGEINWVDGIYTDYLQIPHAAIGPENGGGLIDGVGVSLGSRSPIGSVEALALRAIDELGLRNDEMTGYSMYSSRTPHGAKLIFRKYESDIIRLVTGTGADRSYFLEKVIFGEDSELRPGTALDATSAFIGSLFFGTAVGTTATIDRILTKNPSSSLVELTSIIGMVYSLNSFILQEPFITLSGLSAVQAGQLLNIISTPAITSDNWGHLPSLDQDLGTGDTPAFEGVKVGGLTMGEDLSGATNLLSDHKEWFSIPFVATFANNASITSELSVDIVKNGSQVTISVMGSMSNQFFELSNTVAAIAVGSIKIDLSSVTNAYDSIFTSLPLVQRSSLILVKNDTTQIQCRVTPPTETNQCIEINNWDFDPVTYAQVNLSLPINKKLRIRSFSFSYVIS